MATGNRDMSKREQEARLAWERFCRSGKKPPDIPDRPDLVYAKNWKGWVDWLGWHGPPKVKRRRKGARVGWTSFADRMAAKRVIIDPNEDDGETRLRIYAKSIGCICRPDGTIECSLDQGKQLVLWVET